MLSTSFCAKAWEGYVMPGTLSTESRAGHVEQMVSQETLQEDAVREHLWPDAGERRPQLAILKGGPILANLRVEGLCSAGVDCVIGRALAWVPLDPLRVRPKLDTPSHVKCRMSTKARFCGNCNSSPCRTMSIRQERFSKQS